MIDANSRSYALAVYFLFLICIFAIFVTQISSLNLNSLIGLSALIGIILAHAKEPVARAPFKSHFRFQIRTFWFGFLTVVVGGLLTYIYLGYIILLLFLIWALVRCLKGLIRAVEGNPFEDENTLLW
ncbi:MAG: DUF4870 family protein [Hyphomicrobium sp.]